MLTETALVLRVVSPDTSAVSLFSRIEVHREIAAVAKEWAELESVTPCSIYQTRAFLEPWIETLGCKAGIAPLFVLTRDKTDRCLSLLCLGLVKRGPLRVATWLGGFDSNFNMPLLRPGIDWTTNDVARLLRKAAKACGAEQPDVFALKNQPLEWHDHVNPLALLHHQPAPSAAYGTALDASSDDLFAQKLSKDTRKKLRKKEERLAQLGPLKHLVVANAEEQRRVVDAFLSQKIARFRTQNIVSAFVSGEMRTFIERASPPNGTGIELHALVAGERIVAVYGGAAHGGQWSGMFNSFDGGDEEIAKSSPGDLLLMRIVAKACAEGLTRFDLGIGEARYKAALCDTPISLFDTFFPITPRGRMAARLLAVKQRAKATIKRNPRLLALARRVGSLGA